MPLAQSRIRRCLATVSVTALGYFLTAELTIVVLHLADSTVKASPTWMPAGVAVAALLLFGRQVWLGVAIGAFLSALSAMLAHPIAIALAVAVNSAIGASLQAIVATYLLRRIGFRPSLERLQDAMGFLVMAVLVSPIVSATLNTVVPLLLGVLSWADSERNWVIAWLGDGMGVLVVTPVLLTWRSWYPAIRRRRQMLEVTVGLSLLVGASALVFAAQSSMVLADYPLEYLPFPLVVWAALRFGQAGAVVASLIVSIVAIWGVTLGRGPFVVKSENLSQAVLLLQAFMAVVTITALVLGAAVSERQHTEKLLRRREASLANAQRIAQVGNWDLDLTRQQLPLCRSSLDETWKYPLSWSNELYRLLGFPPKVCAPNQEIFFQTVHPDDRERVKQAFQAAVFEQIPYSMEYRLLLPDGTERIVIEQVEVGATGITGTVQNLTERRQAEAALRESDRRYRAMFEGAAIGIGLDGLDGKILASNRALQSMLGYTEAELSQMTFCQFTHPDDLAADGELFHEMIAGTRDSYQIEKRHIRKDSEIVWVRLTNSLVRDAAGNPQFTIGMVENITELKRAEERIQLFIDIFKNIQIGLIVWQLEDVDDITSFKLAGFNPAAAQILQVKGDMWALKGRPMAEIFPKLPQTQYPKLYADVIRYQTVQDLGEINYGDEFTPEGVFSTKAFPLPDHCVGLAFENVTERKRAEEALQHSEARFRVVAETAACAILVYQGTQFRYVNPATETITGYSREELLAMKFWETVHPDFQAIVRSRGQARQRGEAVPPRYELKILTKGGEERWIDYTAAPVFFEGEPAALGTGFDITERKLAEAQLQLAARRDRLLAEISQRIRQSLDLQEILNTTVAEIRQFLNADRVLISHLDDNGCGRVVAESVDPQWRSLLGWTTDATVAAELRAMFIPQRIRVNHDSSQTVATPFMKQYYERCQVKAGIGAAIMQDDRLFGLLIIHQCSAPRHWHSFEVELLEQLATQVEIAIKQGQLYQQVQNFANRLESQVEERTMQLQQKMQELQELNQFKDILLHAVSHDLRTPIMGTQMLLKNLQNKPGDCLSMPRSRLERMIQSGDRQLDLINSLLEDHTSDSHGLTLHREPLSLGQLVSTLSQEIAPLLQANQVSFTNLTPDNLPLVNGDALQIRRVFDNLITNALQHNCPGIHLTLNATIDPSSHPDGSFVRCTVEDNGIGISQEQLCRLFKLYVRGVHNPHLTGIGLGLYLSRQIVKAHGGEIGVSSSPGNGASFWFTLPVAKTGNSHRSKSETCQS